MSTTSEFIVPSEPRQASIVVGTAAPSASGTAGDPVSATELKKGTLRGATWSAGGQFIRQLINVVGLAVLARVLAPRDFGLMAMLMVFTGFAQMLSELGVESALVQRRTIDREDLDSAFWVNLGVSGLVGVTLVALSTPIAKFYNQPRLVGLICLASLAFPFGAVGSVARAVHARAFRWRFIVLVEVAALAVGTLLSVALASLGWGATALVFQRVATAALSSIFIWSAVGWWPSLNVSRRACREIWVYSRGLIGFTTLNYWSRNADNLLVGRFLGVTALGLYERSYMIILIPVTQMAGVLNRVMFNSLSHVQDDLALFRRMYLRAVGAIAFFTFPSMTALFFVADEFVLTVFGSEWIEIAPTIRIFALVGLVQSIGYTVGWIYLARAETKRYFLWGLISTGITLSSIGIGISTGSIEGLAKSYMVSSVAILAYPSLRLAGQLIGLRVASILRVTADAAMGSVVMAGSLLGMRSVLPNEVPAPLALCISILVGSMTYLLVMLAIRSSSLLYLRDQLLRRSGRRGSRHGGEGVECDAAGPSAWQPRALKRLGPPEEVCSIGSDGPYRQTSGKQMKVALANSLYPPDLVGGAERSVSQLAGDLSTRGLEVIVLTTSRHGQKVESIGSVKVFRLGFANVYWPHGGVQRGFLARTCWHLLDVFNPIMFFRSLRVLRRERPDLLHTNNLMGLSVSVWVAAKSLRIPIVHTLRDYYLMCPRSSMFRGGQNCDGQCFACAVFSRPKLLASRFVKADVGISQFILEAHSSAGFFSRSSLGEVIANSVPPGKIPVLTRAFPERFKVGYLGRIEPEKGVEVLLSALQLLTGEDFQVLIGGQVDDGYRSELSALSGSLSVSFLGRVDPIEFLDSIDVLVVPSVWREPSGRVVLEAQERGVPVIASAVGGLSELIVPGKTGLLYNFSSPLALAEELRRLMRSPELWYALSSGGLSAVQEGIGSTGDGYGRLFGMLVSDTAGEHG